jgi:hypothetical protein
MPIEFDLFSKNPKDPPPIVANALFGTGANCDIVNKKFESTLDAACQSGSKRRIRFANKSTSELCAVAKLNFCIEHEGVHCRFEAEFLICDIAEEIIFGRQLLDETGLLHLVITDKTSPNPFYSDLNNVGQLAIEHFDDIEGEG